jgi:thiol-disulfide isomerase/thioredoxin
MENYLPILYKIYLALLRQVSLVVIVLMPALALAQSPAPTIPVKTDLTYTLTAVNPRTPAKDFSLIDLDSKIRHLSDYRGKVVLLNFWGSWCPPCRREMPSMERLYQALKSEPFIVLAINQSESLDLVFAFTGEIDPTPTFPMLLDSKGEVSSQWNVLGLPMSFIIDKSGHVAYRAMGGREFDHPDIQNKLRALLAE